MKDSEFRMICDYLKQNKMCSISQVCKHFKINRNTFNSKLTKEQYYEIETIKALNKSFIPNFKHGLDYDLDNIKQLMKLNNYIMEINTRNYEEQDF